MKDNNLILAIALIALFSCKKAKENTDEIKTEAKYLVQGSGYKILAAVDYKSDLQTSISNVEAAATYNGGIHAVLKSFHPNVPLSEYKRVITKTDGTVEEITTIPEKHNFSWRYSLRQFFLTPNSKDITAVNQVTTHDNKVKIDVTKPDGSVTQEFTSGNTPVLYAESPQKIHAINQMYFQGWSGGYITYLYGYTYQDGTLVDLKEREIGNMRTEDIAGIGLSSSPCYYFDKQRTFWMLDTRTIALKNYLFVWKQDAISNTYKELTVKQRIPKKHLVLVIKYTQQEYCCTLLIKIVAIILMLPPKA